jgi:1-acyl-sn-glycerol-3-phosphate acyltransferase
MATTNISILSYFRRDMAIGVYLLPERLFLLPLLRWRMIEEEVGRDKLSRDTPYIFAVNHNSHLDEFAVMPPIVMSTHRKTHFFADRKHWFQGKLIFRFLAWRFQAIPVDRGKGTADDSLKRGADYIRKGHNLIIYPEGTRGDGFHLGRGKVGVAKLALWTGVPVVPIGVWGTHLLMPKGDHMPKLKRIVKITVGDPIHFEDKVGQEGDKEVLREVTDKVMRGIAELVEQDYPY